MEEGMAADRPGSMVVFEGPDGVGKTTTMRRVSASIRSRGIEVVETRNVGGTPFAEQIRDMLLFSSSRIDPVQQNLLIAAARRSSIVEVVIPALERGALVMCDRYVPSALVFQTLTREGGASICDRDVIDLHASSCGGFEPDLMIHMHAPADVRAHRRSVRSEGLDRFDNGDAEFDRAVAEKYARAGGILGYRTVDVDCSGDADEVARVVEGHVLPFADGTERSIVRYEPHFAAGGRWVPHRDARGLVYRTPDAHEANEECRALWRSAGSAQLRIVPRRVALAAAEGLRTSELDDLTRRR